MKKLLIQFSFAFVFVLYCLLPIAYGPLPIVLCHALGPVNVMSGYVGAAGDTYSDILFWWRCESTTMGAGDHSHGDTTATLSSLAAINTDAVKMGTNGLDIPTSSDYATFSVSSSDIFVEAAGRIGFWLRINTWLASYLVDATLASGNFRFYLTGTSEMTFRYNDGVGGDRYANTTTAALTTATWYFIEIAWDVSTELQKIFVDGVEKATNTQAKSSTGAATAIRFGEPFGVPNTDYHMDNIIISNDPTRNLYLLKDTDSFPG